MYYLPKKFGFLKQTIKNKSSLINEPIYENLLKYKNPIANSMFNKEEKVSRNWVYF